MCSVEKLKSEQQSEMVGLETHSVLSEGSVGLGQNNVNQADTL